MLSRVLRTIEEHRLIAGGDRVLCAVSGGPDSTALLHALVRLRERLRITVGAAVIDHGLRPESAKEAQLVAERCGALGVTCRIERVDVVGVRGQGRHISWQDAARRARHAALEAIASEGGFDVVALGHTADDQVETILFRLVRGTGLAGLAGMPYKRGVFVRPLLDVRRAEVLLFLRRRRVPFLEDPSNADHRFARARVRHAWLPFLRRENPRVDEALLHLGEEARALAPRAAAPPAGLGAPGATPEALAALGLSRRTAATVARLARARSGSRRVSIRGGELEVRYGRVRFRARAAAAAGPTQELCHPGHIAGPGRFQASTAEGEAPTVEVSLGGAADRAPEGAAVFDLAVVGWPLGLRTPRAGDRVRPRGGRGSRKLSDMLVDAKIPRFLRAAWPVVTAADGEIVYVPGLRPSARGAPSASTSRWVALRETSENTATNAAETAPAAREKR